MNITEAVRWLGNDPDKMLRIEGRRVALSNRSNLLWADNREPIPGRHYSSSHWEGVERCYQEVHYPQAMMALALGYPVRVINGVKHEADTYELRMEDNRLQVTIFGQRLTARNFVKPTYTFSTTSTRMEIGFDIAEDAAWFVKIFGDEKWLEVPNYEHY